MEQYQALDIIRTFITRNRGYCVDRVPFPKQGMNSWVFKGTYCGRSIIFKVSKRNAASRESDALEYFSASGLVPEVLHCEGDKLLVMEFIPGETWLELILKGIGEERALLDSIVEAISLFVQVAREKDDFEPKILEKNLEVTLNTSQNVLRANSSLYGDEVFFRTLDIIMRLKRNLVRERSCLYFDDMSPNNFIVYNGRFSKFIDLESCWRGTLHLQFGALVANLTNQILKELPFNAQRTLYSFYSVFETMFSLNREMVQACAFLKTWIRIVRFNGWNGWSTWDGGEITENLTKQKQKAEAFAQQLRRTENMFRVQQD